MMTMPDQSHRNERAIAEAAFANPNVSWFKIKTTGRIGMSSITISSFVAGVLAAVFGASVAAYVQDEPGPLAWLMASGCGFFGFMAFFAVMVFVNRTSYEGEFIPGDFEDEEETADAFLRVDRDGSNQTRRVSRAMIEVLGVIARNYEQKGRNLAIDRWCGSNNPLSRKQIVDARAFLVEWGFAYLYGRQSEIRLNEKGEAAIIEWRSNNFQTLDNPPTPNEGTTRV